MEGVYHDDIKNPPRSHETILGTFVGNGQDGGQEIGMVMKYDKRLPDKAEKVVMLDGYIKLARLFRACGLRAEYPIGYSTKNFLQEIFRIKNIPLNIGELAMRQLSTEASGKKKYPAQSDDEAKLEAALEETGNKPLLGVLGMARNSKNADGDNKNQPTDQQNIQTDHDQSPSLLSKVATTNEATENNSPATNTPVLNNPDVRNCPITNAANTSLPISNSDLANSNLCVLPNLNLNIYTSLPQYGQAVKEGTDWKMRAQDYTLDRIARELEAAIDFDSSVFTLKNSVREESYVEPRRAEPRTEGHSSTPLQARPSGARVKRAEFDNKMTPYEKTGQSLILYADDLLENAAVVDLEDTIRKMQAILEGGKIILFAQNKANVAILERMIKRANPKLETVIVAKDDLRNGNEISALMDTAKAKGAREVLAIIRGPMNDPESFKDTLSEYKVPLVFLSGEKGIYSLAEALARAIAKKNAEGENGWLIMLEPIRVLTEDLQAQYDNYKRALAALQAA